MERLKLSFVSSILLLDIMVDAFFLTQLNRCNHNIISSKTSLHAQRRDPASANQFIRLQSRTVRGSRQSFELQTAVTTFSRVDENGESQTIDLHAQLHFGEQDYFDYYNSKEFSSLYDALHYELLTDNGLMELNEFGQRRLRASSDGKPVLMASPSDQQTARQYGLVCQVDFINYSNPRWIHADMTRQELLASAKKKGTQQPLWALASTAPSLLWITISDTLVSRQFSRKTRSRCKRKR
jgi:hypothetical protein